MELGENYEKYMNRIAADIKTCPKCDSEDVTHLMSSAGDKWLCENCGNTFDAEI